MPLIHSLLKFLLEFFSMNIYTARVRKHFIFIFLLFSYTCFADLDISNSSFYDYDNAQLSLRAIQLAYPELEAHVVYDPQAKDWCLQTKKETLYWAHGRMLPKNEKDRWNEWRALIDYFYPDTPFDPQYLIKEELERLKPRNLAPSRAKMKTYNNAFFKFLYGNYTKSDILKKLTRRYTFLGKPIFIHKHIAGKLTAVENKIFAKAHRSPEVRQFVKNVLRADGFSWRSIRDSEQRSNHSWGIALDILPKDWKKYNVYWLWAAHKKEMWMKIPPKNRWSPPQEIIDIFESEGFIWGGKWMLWDTMHFEYRPELIILQKLLSENKEYRYHEENIRISSEDFPPDYFLPEVVFAEKNILKKNHPVSKSELFSDAVKNTLAQQQTLSAVLNVSFKKYIFIPVQEPKNIQTAVFALINRQTSQFAKNKKAMQHKRENMLTDFKTAYISVLQILENHKKATAMLLPALVQDNRKLQARSELYMQAIKNASIEAKKIRAKHRITSKEESVKEALLFATTMEKRQKDSIHSLGIISPVNIFPEHFGIFGSLKNALVFAKSYDLKQTTAENFINPIILSR
ncbi:hypothetical protein C5O78_01670 [Treponema phagedenis]|nr:hypothetical protein C5O78_01670 [Treponema phagedenis]